MKRWLCLALLGIGVCLLLALYSSNAGMSADRALHLVGRSASSWGEPAATTIASLAAVENPAPAQTRAAAAESRTLPWLPIGCAVGPPGLDNRAPPGPVLTIFAGSRLRKKHGSVTEKHSLCATEEQRRRDEGFCNRL